MFQYASPSRFATGESAESIGDAAPSAETVLEGGDGVFAVRGVFLAGGDAAAEFADDAGPIGEKPPLFDAAVAGLELCFVAGHDE